jgi:hypothetical protein
LGSTDHATLIDALVIAVAIVKLLCLVAEG